MSLSVVVVVVVLVVSRAISVPLFIDDCVGYFRVGLNSMGVVIVGSVVAWRETEWEYCDPMKRERDINNVGLLIRLWTRGCEGTIRQCYHPYLVELDRFVAHHLARALPVMMAAAVRFVETVVDVWPSNTPAMEIS